MGRRNSRSIFWGAVVWLLRAGVGAAAYFAWLAFSDWDYTGAGIYAAAAVAALFLQFRARRLWMGWAYDENGERQKAQYWLRGEPYSVSPKTTREQRLSEEAFWRDRRRRTLAWTALVGFPAAYLTWWLWAQQVDFLAFIDVPVFLFTCFVLGQFGYYLLLELLYLAGFQDMPGARVMDLELPKPGLEEVIRQQAHGGARLASEDEAIELLNPKD